MGLAILWPNKPSNLLHLRLLPEAQPRPRSSSISASSLKHNHALAPPEAPPAYLDLRRHLPPLPPRWSCAPSTPTSSDSPPIPISTNGPASSPPDLWRSSDDPPPSPTSTALPRSSPWSRPHPCR
ncbi:hypothetical protein VPH35_021708 [Triticum aestivum]